MRRALFVLILIGASAMVVPTVSAADKKTATGELPKVASMIDKLAKRGTIHKNKAANLKSKLARRVNAQAK